MLRIQAIVVISLIALSVGSKPAGLVASVDQDVMVNFKNFITPTVIHEINSIDIGRIDFDGGHIDQTSFKLAIVDENSLNVKMSGKDNGFVIKAHDISGSFSGKFYYKIMFLTFHGNFDVEIKNGGCTLDTIAQMKS